MTDDYQWAKKFFRDEEIDEINDKTNQIIFNNQNGFVVNLVLSNEQCMDLVHHYTIVASDNDGETDLFNSYEFLDGFMSHFIDFIELHLTETNPDWPDEYYG